MGYMEDLENKEYDTTNLRRVIKKLEKELEVIDKKIKESGYIEKIDLIRKQQIHEELINRYIALNNLESMDLSYLIGEHMAEKQMIDEKLKNYDYYRFNQSYESKSWNEYKKEEAKNERNEDREDDER